MDIDRYKNRKKRLEYKKNYVKEHKKEIREYYRKWYVKNGRGRSVDYAEAISEWRINHPKEFIAQKKLQHAVKIGKIIKPKNCEDCLEERRLSAHHEDYEKPLKVVWLCSSCHKIRHEKYS